MFGLFDNDMKWLLVNVVSQKVSQCPGDLWVILEDAFCDAEKCYYTFEIPARALSVDQMVLKAEYL